MFSVSYRRRPLRLLYNMHLAHKIIVWDEAQTPKAISAAGDNADNDVTAEAAQFLLHRPKRQAVKVCVCCYSTCQGPFPGGGCLFVEGTHQYFEVDHLQYHLTQMPLFLLSEAANLSIARTRNSKRRC